MKFTFYKYQGTGNDFILLDNRGNTYPELPTKTIAGLCDRRFGIGADGLIYLNSRSGFDFEMKYYNADGRESSMCGNGGRCLVKFAYHLGIHKSTYRFLAIDGEHLAEIEDGSGIVNLKMKDVDGIDDYEGNFLLDTGSPHYVKVMADVMDVNVVTEGFEIRHSPDFEKLGINVNFVEQKKDDEIIVRTYERGVEDETLSCGTGVTASALVLYHNEVGYNDVTVHTRGGTLVVKYDRRDDETYRDIWLCGPAERTFEGKVDIAL